MSSFLSPFFPWLRHQAQLLRLFLLGAALPLGGILLLLAAGVLMFGSITGLVLGLLLLSNGLYGLVASFKSFPRPTGRKLDAENAPELLASLDALARAWKGPRAVDAVLDPGFWSLDLVGVPTLGLLGWPRFTWLLGVQPLLALSEREFEALASWELVWWCDQQSWLNLQVKRLAAYWSRLNATLQEPTSRGEHLRDRWSKAFLRPYGRWVHRIFEPFLIEELVRTDTVLAHHYGSATLARALCRAALLKPLLECRLYSEWNHRLKSGEAMPQRPCTQVIEFLGRWPEDADGLLALALDGLVPEAPPLLRFRLDQLGEAPIVPLPSRASAHFLETGGLLPTLDAEWAERISEMQEEARRTQAHQERRFSGLRATLATGFPNHPDAKEYLELAADRLPCEEFADLAQRYLAAFPEDREAPLLLLKSRLRGGENPSIQGQAQVQTQTPAQAQAQAAEMMERNPFRAPACLALLEGQARRSGDAGQAESHWIRRRRCEVEIEAARRERQSVSLRDQLEPHGLDETALQAIRAFLADTPSIRKAFVVRKHLNHFPHLPVYLLVIQWRAPFWDPRGMKRARFQLEIAQNCPFPPESSPFVLVTTGRNLWPYNRKLKRLDAIIDISNKPESSNHQ